MNTEASATSDDQWSMYILLSQTNNRTYVGVTKNLSRRVRQHNGEITGGAKSTRGRGPWRPMVEVRGLSKRIAHQLEWRMHQLGKKRRPRGLGNFEKRLYHLKQVLGSSSIVPYSIWWADGAKPVDDGFFGVSEIE